MWRVSVGGLAMLVAGLLLLVSPVSAWTPCDFWPAWCATPTPAPATPTPVVVTATPRPEDTPVPTLAVPLPWFCDWRPDLFPAECPVIIRATSTPVGTATNTPTVGPAPDRSTYPREVLRLLNVIRAENSLAPLLWNDKLGRAAGKYAKQLSDLSPCFSHECPPGYSVGDRADAEGYNWLGVGENISAGRLTPSDVVGGWMNSPGHHALILMPEFQDAGVGFYYANPGTPFPTYWVLILGY